MGSSCLVWANDFQSDFVVLTGFRNSFSTETCHAEMHFRADLTSARAPACKDAGHVETSCGFSMPCQARDFRLGFSRRPGNVSVDG